MTDSAVDSPFPATGTRESFEDRKGPARASAGRDDRLLERKKKKKNGNEPSGGERKKRSRGVEEGSTTYYLVA